MNTLPSKSSNQSSLTNTIIAGHFKLTPTGLEVIGDPTFDDWLSCGKYLYKTNESLQFIIGDYLQYGEQHWGETYRKAVEVFGFDIQTLRNSKWVSRSIQPEPRHPELSFSHHREVAELEPEEQDELLTEASNNKLSVSALHKLIAQRRMVNTEPSKSRQTDSQVSPRGDTLAQPSFFSEALEKGREFVKALRKLKRVELTDDEKDQINDILDEIGEAVQFANNGYAEN